MKSLAAQNGRIVRELGVSADLARRYSLSLPITSLVCGIQTKEELRHDIKLAKNFTPLTEEEVKEILAIAEPESHDGHIEVYKTGDYGCNWHHDKYA
jgi:predicted aldo/keto reductase-like oxidoreductase